MLARHEGLDGDLVGGVEDGGHRLRRPQRRSRQRQARESRLVGRSKLKLEIAARSRRGKGIARRPSMSQGVGDRNLHVRKREARGHGAVAPLHEAVNDGLRMDQHVERSGPRPKRWCASMSSRPLFIRVAESMLIFDPMDQTG